ncbi:MAG: transglutaminase domain-containing protein [Clostridiales bacterium]|nr:transglutaminase domain-containing protein [Clostridiales bacterium]
MRGRAKIGYIIGAVIIGVIAVLAVYFALIGFGVVDYRKEKLIFVSQSAIKEYDGTPLECHLYEITEGKLKDGHTAEIEYSGSQTEVGTGNNSFTVVIKDSNNQDVTENYIVELQPGTLTVNKREIAVQSHSAQRVYDGQPLSNENADIVAGSLVEGHTLSVSGFASTDRGTVNNTFVATILNGEEDVTASYNITYIFGDLVVSRIPISLRAIGAEKEYDGKPLTDDKYTVRSGSLLEGHEITDVTFDGSQLFVGKSENNITFARVVDEEGNDWSDVYEITFYAGELSVTPRPLTVIPTPAEKEYDGLPLSSAGGEISELTPLINGDYAEFYSDTTITDAGEAVINMTVIITNEDGADVSECYDVTIGLTAAGKEAKLVIKPRELVVESGSSTRIFDGRTLNEHSCKIIQGSLVEGHELVETYYTDIMHVGTVNNEFAVAVYCGEDNVTENYNIKLRFGKLTITSRYIALKSGNANKVYDGTELVCHDPLTRVGELADNHYLEVDYLGTITEVGSVENTFVVLVLEETEGVTVDHTDDYTIVPFYGTLTVYPRSMTVYSDTKSREYIEGVALTAPDWWCESDSTPTALIEGHKIIIDVTGSQTEVGQSPNTISSIDIIDLENNGKLVTYNYNITVRQGLLTVFEKENDSDLDDDGRMNNDKAQTDNPVVDIMSTANKAVYLRYKSFGNYDGGGFKNAEDYTALINGTYSANYLAGEAIKGNGTAEELRIISTGTSNYLLPYYLVMGGTENYEIQSSDVIYDGNPKTEYVLTYYPYDYTIASTIFTSGYGDYSAYGNALRTYVYNTYLSLSGASPELIDYLMAERDRMGFTSSDPYVIRKIANYIKGSAKYDMEYDKALDGSSDVVYAFLKQYRMGVCRHYAAAATLMFRAVGIPARYCIGYKANTKAAEWVKVTTKSAHAWVEVFVNGVGWVMVEVTGGDGNNGQNDGTISIKPVDVSAKFTSYTDVLRPTNEIQGLYNLKALNYRWDVTVEGSQVGPGTSESYITDFVLYDPSGRVVTDNFEIRFGKGKLQIYYEQLTLTTQSHTKSYDGYPFSEMGEEDYSVTGTIMDGHYVKSCRSTTELYKVGSAPNSYSLVIADGAGNNVTHLYNIKENFGELTIMPRRVVIETASKTWSYGDEPSGVYKCEEYEVYNTDGTVFPRGDGEEFYFTMEFTASLTKRGSSTENTVQNVRVFNKYNEDVTDMFSIDVKLGMMEVDF